jgi:transposase-like protein
MPQRTKLPPEEKIKIVEDYLAGRMGMSDFERRYKLKGSRLYEWVRLYKTRGVEGLIPTNRFRKYSSETKLMAVKDYLSGLGSQSEICTKYDISSNGVLQRWIKWYNSHEDFRQPNSGGNIYMARGRKTTLEERVEIVSQSDGGVLGNVKSRNVLFEPF